MYFKQILNEDNGCSSYVIADRQTHECAVVDPALDIEPYLEIARDRELTVRFIIDTHLHADHVSGNRRLAAATGAGIYLGPGADVHFSFKPLREGQVLSVGKLLLTVMETPGHRPESISLVVTNPPRSPEPSMVLTGDCLFVGDVGRPDFGGPEAAAQQYASNHRLMQLNDYVEVFPAHFEGACGRGMCGRPSSTIGFERRFNPMLRFDNVDGFVRELTAVRPAKPLNMEAIVATNQGTADMSWAMLRHPLPHVEDVTADLAQPRIERADWWVLDVREEEEWRRMHIPGAHHIPQAQLASRLNEIPDGAVPLIVCHSGVRSHRAAQFLKQNGYQEVFSLAGGTSGWQQSGRPVEQGDSGSTVSLSEVVGIH
jgi:glyoxylase-like metal-dependent hydrolase (beta-lactamase superfamily II)/rhodanese-related sulfurtransferase